MLAILVLIAVSTTNQALPAFRHAGLELRHRQGLGSANGKFGALAFICGTCSRR